MTTKPEVLSADAVDSLRPLPDGGHLPADYLARDELRELCDSHEALRSELVEYKAMAERMAANPNVIHEIEACGAQFEKLRAELSTAQETVKAQRIAYEDDRESFMRDVEGLGEKLRLMSNAKIEAQQERDAALAENDFLRGAEMASTHNEQDMGQLIQQLRSERDDYRQQVVAAEQREDRCRWQLENKHADHIAQMHALNKKLSAAEEALRSARGALCEECLAGGIPWQNSDGWMHSDEADMFACSAGFAINEYFATPAQEPTAGSVKPLAEKAENSSSALPAVEPGEWNPAMDPRDEEVHERGACRYKRLWRAAEDQIEASEAKYVELEAEVDAWRAAYMAIKEVHGMDCLCTAHDKLRDLLAKPPAPREVERCGRCGSEDCASLLPFPGDCPKGHPATTVAEVKQEYDKCRAIDHETADCPYCSGTGRAVEDE